ncbi:glycosyl hydrolase family 18 protein [Hyalangium versicolor]|uniref:glycosyl hydrolase family 18 protein n=1 Tax=Hyalangium versicolor TaxID=2861190 RepID=UPI001CCC3851|nr:glycosyl hydrolase family 18 protein [Hyalangium versicolor]
MFLATLLACSGQPEAVDSSAMEPTATLQSNALTTKVVGYFPTWQGDVNAIQYDKVSHIIYAFLLPTAQGGLSGVSTGDSRLQALVQNSHARGVKVLIAIGGWMDGNDAPFEQLAANASARATFINNVVNFVNAAGLDGADIDWEWPDAGASAQNYGTLMRELGTALHSRGKLLTSAVVGVSGEGIPSSAFSDVDFLNIMAYDGGYPHSPYSFASQSLSYWLGRGLAKEKAVLGAPFYGRSPSTALTYAQLVAMDSQAPYKDNVGDVYYNGIATIQAKAKLGSQQGGGIMIWELSQDTQNDTSLLRAIYQVVSSGGGTNQAPSVSLTSPSNGASFSAGSSITLSANASDADGTIAKVEFFAGATKVGEDISAPYSISWTNVGAGSYALTAKATDNGGAVTTSASVSITVTGSGGSCGSVAPWSSSKVYVKDDQATYNGSLWRAKWWTQNETPSNVEWGPWQFVSNC